jgi:hypothetical protein
MGSLRPGTNFKEFRVALANRYKMRDEGELQRFLGIRVVRDRANQDSYIKSFKMQGKRQLRYRLKLSTHTTDKPILSRSTYTKVK